MQRILIIVVILYVIWRVLYAYGRRMARQSQGAEDFSRFSGRRRARRGDGDGPGEGREQQLARCPGCGTYVPEERLLTASDGAAGYCSEACRRAHLLEAASDDRDQ